MVEVSRNLQRGRRITSPQQILKLADEGKSIAWLNWGRTKYAIKPAAVFANWPLRLIQMQLTTGRLFETRPKAANNAQ